MLKLPFFAIHGRPSVNLHIAVYGVQVVKGLQRPTSGLMPATKGCTSARADLELEVGVRQEYANHLPFSRTSGLNESHGALAMTLDADFPLYSLVEGFGGWLRKRKLEIFDCDRVDARRKPIQTTNS